MLFCREKSNVERRSVIHFDEKSVCFSVEREKRGESGANAVGAA